MIRHSALVVLSVLFTAAVGSTQNLGDEEFLLGPVFNLGPVTTLTTNADPDVATAPDGSSVAVWVSGQINVRGQRYDSAGAAVGSEFAVSGDTYRTKAWPSVCMDSSGGFTVAWQQREVFMGTDDDIQVRRFDSTGVPVFYDQLANSIATGDQNVPDVACADSGDFVVSWEGPGTGGLDAAHANRFSSSGTLLGGEFQVNTHTASNIDWYSQQPRVAGDAAGNFVVAWNQDVGAMQELSFRRYDGSGAALDASQVAARTESYFLRFNLARERTNGDFVLAHNGAAGYTTSVELEHFGAGGTLEGSHSQVDASASARTAMAVAFAGPNEEYVVVWNDNGYSNGVRAQRFAGSATPVGAEFEFHDEPFTSDGHRISAAGDATGEFTVVWENHGNTYGRRVIRAALFSDDFETGGPGSWSSCTGCVVR